MKNILISLLLIGFVSGCDFNSGNSNKEDTSADAGTDILSNNQNNNNDIIDAGTDSDIQDSGSTEDLWFVDDPLGRITEGNISGTRHGDMIIVTSSDLAMAWQTFAGIKTGEGIFTEVITTDEIYSISQGNDDAEKIRNFLKERFEEGSLKFVLLGGDASKVPFRRVENYIFATEEYTANGPSQLYFSNLTVNFDSDGDGNYGEKDEDFTLEQSRHTDIAAGRVSASNEQEVYNYTDKYIKYSTAQFGRMTFSLLLSDIASTLPIIGDIDAAEGVEVTFDAYFYESYHNNVKKLYATSSAASLYDAEVISVQKVHDAIGEGYPMVFHNGHGGHGWITDILNTAFVESLDNSSPGVWVSCACLSGNFADKAVTATYDGWTPQGENEDSAAEKYINGPYGGVAYIGNTGTGLGPIGGSQFLHAFYEGIFQEGLTYIGEAFNYGRANARNVEYSLAYLPVSMTDDSEWWTSHVIILLGDPSLKIWTENLQRLIIDSPVVYGPGYAEMQIMVKDVNDTPVSGAIVTMTKPGDFVIQGTSDENGVVNFNFMPIGPEKLHITAVAPAYFHAYSVVLPESGN